MKRRILVVDDVDDAAQTLAALLRLSGHEVHTARDGAGAIEAAYRVRPEFIFVDLGLPGGIDGWQVVKRLRSDPSFTQTRILAVTGFADEASRRRSLEAGIELHLIKPLNMNFVESLLVPRGR